MTEVRLPLLAADTRFGFYEFNRRRDFALAMALVAYRVERGSSARRGSRPAASSRSRAGSDKPSRRSPEIRRGAAFAAAAEAAAAAVDPLEDAITSAEYRRDLTRTVTRRALERALA